MLGEGLQPCRRPPISSGAVLRFGSLPFAPRGAPSRYPAGNCGMLRRCPVARHVLRVVWQVTMADGIVVFFKDGTGFGYIEPSDGSDDVLIDDDAAERARLARISDGQRVTYD